MKNFFAMILTHLRQHYWAIHWVADGDEDLFDEVVIVVAAVAVGDANVETDGIVNLEDEDVVIYDGT